MAAHLSKSQVEQIFNSQNDFKHVELPLLTSSMESAEGLKIIVDVVNKLLSSTYLNKVNGIGYLNHVLPFCTKEVLKENSIWLNHCYNAWQKDKFSMFRLNILGNIFESYQDIEELHKEITQYLPKVITFYLEEQTKRVESREILRFIKICLLHYPGSCNSFKKQLELFILQYLDESLPLLVVKDAAVCFHYMQQIGFASLEKINYTNNWSQQMNYLCATMHTLLNSFLAQVGNEPVSFPTEGRLFPSVQTDLREEQEMSLYLNRLTNTIIFMKTMLEYEFSAPKNINPHSIIYIIQRGFLEHVHCTGESLFKAHFSVLLIKLQERLLFLLRSLLASLDHDVLMNSFTITKIFIDCIAVMEHCNCLKSNRSFLKTFYSVLNFWLSIVKNQINHIYQDKLLLFLSSQLEYEKGEITLNLRQNENKSKKAKRKALSENINKLHTTPLWTARSLANNKINENLCIYTLDALKHFLTSVYLNVKPDTCKTLYNTVLKILMNIQSGDFEHPYLNEVCQEKLYEVLILLYEQPNLSACLPLKLCIGLLTNGLNNRNNAISLVCLKGLHILEKISQPVCSSLYVFREFPKTCDSGSLEFEKDTDDLVDVKHMSVQTEEQGDCQQNKSALLFSEKSDSDKIVDNAVNSPTYPSHWSSISDMSNSIKSGALVVESDGDESTLNQNDNNCDNELNEQTVAFRCTESKDDTCTNISEEKLSNVQSYLQSIADCEPSNKKAKINIDELNDNEFANIMENFVPEVNDY